MTIAGGQNELLRAALESAFPTQGKLEVMLRETLARDLKDVAGETYSQRISDLIQAAESQGWKIDLIAGARLRNPGNPKLQNFIAQFIESLFDDFYRVSSQLGQRLIRLLQQIPEFSAIVHALRSTLPIGFEDHCTFWMEELQNSAIRRSLQIFALLKLLLRDYPQTGVLPFVNQLVGGRKLEPALQQDFQRWLNEAQNQTGQILPQVQQNPADLEEKHPCLFVEVKESLSKLSFYLKASLSVSGSKADLEPFGETQIDETQSTDGQCEFTHTRAWINQLLDRVEERLSAEPLEVEVRELTLEVFLPCEHLLEAIDQWQIEAGEKMGRRYRVVLRSHARIDPEKDRQYWADLRSLASTRTRDIDRGRTFRVPEDDREYERVIDAVNAALYLRRPLLITGKPGSGKTSLAYAIAYELMLGPVLLWSITTRSILTTGLYQYDAIARLQDAQLSETERKIAQLGQEPPGNLVERYRDIGRYIRLGAVGTAFLPSRSPRVLLIDEIDKSDINLPNDLLNLFEEGEFPIAELKRLAEQGNRLQTVTSEDEQKVEILGGQVQCEAFPIVIMTSNGERDFPPAFLRRCLQVRMPDPTEADLVQIVEAHLQGSVSQEFRSIIRDFAQMNESEAGERATDQLLNLLYILNQKADRDRLKELLFKPLTGTDLE